MPTRHRGRAAGSDLRDRGAPVYTPYWIIVYLARPAGASGDVVPLPPTSQRGRLRALRPPVPPGAVAVPHPPAVREARGAAGRDRPDRHGRCRPPPGGPV